MKMSNGARTAEPLSARETEVLTLIAEGRDYRTIGERLFVAERTVEAHARSIRRKLKAKTRRELVAHAFAAGLAPAAQCDAPLTAALSVLKALAPGELLVLAEAVRRQLEDEDTQ